MVYSTGSVSVKLMTCLMVRPREILVRNTPTSGTHPSWMDWWTIFYWGWWIAWSPFVGVFLTRISRGRTIKQVINFTLTLPVLYIMLWFGTFGGAGIRMHRKAELLQQAGTDLYNDPAAFGIVENASLPSFRGNCYDVPAALPCPTPYVMTAWGVDSMLTTAIAGDPNITSNPTVPPIGTMILTDGFDDSVIQAFLKEANPTVDSLNGAEIENYTAAWWEKKALAEIFSSTATTVP